MSERKIGKPCDYVTKFTGPDTLDDFRPYPFIGCSHRDNYGNNCNDKNCPGNKGKIEHEKT
jgi:hypothetical protein